MDPETSFTQIYNQSDADKSASGMASSSQDPSFTPGSTTELPSRTGVQDTAVGRVLPFSQVAPGFDTPIPIGVSTAPFGTGAAEAAAIAERTRKLREIHGDPEEHRERSQSALPSHLRMEASVEATGVDACTQGACRPHACTPGASRGQICVPPMLVVTAVLSWLV